MKVVVAVQLECCIYCYSTYVEINNINNLDLFIMKGRAISNTVI